MHLTRALAAATRRLPKDYHNMPSRFVDRHTRFIIKRAPNLPQYEQKIFRYKNRAYYDEWRPWEYEFRTLNRQGSKVSKIYVEPIREWNFFRGDRVVVIKGPEKGKQGIINHIVKERNWVFVQGLNLRRNYINNNGLAYGNIICKEDPFLINIEVKLVDPTDLMPTEAEWRLDDAGNRVRVSTRTERILPIPEGAYQTIDYVEKSGYIEADKDTLGKDAIKNTFVPKAKTFEMDICDEMGIKDDRVPYPMYWY